MRALVLFGGATLAGLAAIAAAQTAVPASETEVVRIDAVVTDGDGKAILDLTEADFEVLEDGKRQTLTVFTQVGTPAAAPASPAAPSAATAEAETAAPAPARRVLIVVDDTHIALAGLEATKKALKRLLGEFVAADDEVALVTTRMTTGGGMGTFSRERSVLLEAIEALRPREVSVAAARSSHMTPGQAEMILTGDRGAVELAARTMISEPGSIYDNMGPRAAIEGGMSGSASQAATGSPEAKQVVAENDARRQARAVLQEALTGSTASLRAVEGALRSLADMPGRKVCLLVSDGFLIGTGTSEERTEEIQRVVDAATRSGVAVYALDSRGLVPAGREATALGAGAAPGLQFRIQRQVEQIATNTIAHLAEQTGGFLVHGTNDLEAGLRRMLDDSRAYYLLAYEPANTKRDGRFRKLEVKLPRQRGLTVRTRRGYFAPDDKNPARRPAPAPVDLRALLDQPLPAGSAGSSLRLSAHFLDLPPGGSQALVHARLDVSSLGWQKADDRQRAAFDVILGAFSADGAAAVAPSARRVELSLTSGELKRAKEDGFRYRQSLPLPPGRYQVRVLARDPAGTAIGGAAEWVEIPDLAAKTLATSSVFLSSSPGSAAGGTDDGGARDVSIARRFKRGDTLFFQLYVYNPQVDGGASDVVLQAQLRSGETLIGASKPQPVAFLEKDGVPVPYANSMSLAGLSAGAYELRVVVVDRKAGANATRTIDFTLD